jgi:hypothetical protein
MRSLFNWGPFACLRRSGYAQASAFVMIFLFFGVREFTAREAGDQGGLKRSKIWNIDEDHQKKP